MYVTQSQKKIKSCWQAPFHIYLFHCSQKHRLFFSMFQRKKNHHHHTPSTSACYFTDRQQFLLLFDGTCECHHYIFTYMKYVYWCMARPLDPNYFQTKWNIWARSTKIVDIHQQLISPSFLVHLYVCFKTTSSSVARWKLCVYCVSDHKGAF